MQPTSQPDPTDGPPDERTEKALAYLREFVEYQPGTTMALQREKASGCLDVLATALRVVPPEGGPRHDTVLRRRLVDLLIYCAQQGKVANGTTGALDLLNAYDATVRASGAGNRQEESPLFSDRPNSLLGGITPRQQEAAQAAAWQEAWRVYRDMGVADPTSFWFWLRAKAQIPAEELAGSPPAERRGEPPQ